MTNQLKAQQYKSTGVKTASREQILIMLYEAAIRHHKVAIECIEKKDLAGKGQAIGKAHDIINELVNSLDFNVGGQIATDLERLYNFMIEQMIKSNLENSTDCLTQNIKLMETLLV